MLGSNSIQAGQINVLSNILIEADHSQNIFPKSSPTNEPRPIQNPSVIQTPPEDPKYSIFAAVCLLTLFVAIVMPIWTVLGAVLYFPAKALRACNFSSPHKERIEAIYSFSKEIFSIWSAGLKYFSTFWKSYEVTMKKGNTPILLIHGYLHNKSGWSTYLKKLAERGSIYTINLSHPFLPIQTYADEIKAKAEEIAKETGREDLILIGHSMGGLIASLYATKVAPQGKVKKVFTIGTPLKGCSSAVASITIGPNGRQMRPNSPLLQEIQKAIIDRPDIKFYHVASNTDELVPKKNAIVGEGEQFIVSLGHLNLMSSKTVADWIRDRL